MKNKLLYITGGLLIISIATIAAIHFLNKNDDTSNMNVEDLDNTVHLDNTEIDWNTYDSHDTATSSDNDVTITEKGIYTLTGEINGKVIVNTSGNVKLILDNVTIKSESGPCILISEASNVVIELKEGTVNTLEDTSNYTDYQEEAGTIFSHDDLIIEGTGTLKITSNYLDAIVSKDDLTINNGTFIINSADDGIRGKDSVHITGGNFTITSKGDGIKASNDTETDKGNIVIDGGTFKIVSDLDGIQAVNKVVISDGTFDITTGGGSSNSSTNSNWGQWGNNKTQVENTSAKGIKAGDNIIIYNGTFTLNTSDDAIHSNNYVGITKGEITINSGDDGIHADTTLVIDGGTINIEKSYEGLEGANITINGGNISVVASDDGLNAAGGNDSSSNDRPGANNFNSSSNNKLTINGGTLYVNSTGDGLDANGSIYLTGGDVVVDGPTDNGNGALDYDSEFVVTGGSLITVGSSGMSQGISSNSTVYGALINLTSTYQKGTTIIITDSNGNEIISYTANKTFSSIAIANTKLEKGKTYTVLLNGTEYTTFTTSSISTTVGNAGMGGGQGGNPGQQGPGRR